MSRLTPLPKHSLPPLFLSLPSLSYTMSRLTPLPKHSLPPVSLRLTSDCHSQGQTGPAGRLVTRRDPTPSEKAPLRRSSSVRRTASAGLAGRHWSGLDTDGQWRFWVVAALVRFGYSRECLERLVQPGPRRS